MKACVFTLGCKMNEVESESLMAGLYARGYEVTEKLEYADLYLLNTCAVTAEAEKKSRQAVARMRKFNDKAPILVCGCASQFHPKSFAEKEGVTVVTGTQDKGKILDMVDRHGIFMDEISGEFCDMVPPKRAKTRAYLRIQDGCNHFCSYCIIPYLRGRTRSRGVESILREARETQAKEIVLTGIDISSYRSDNNGLGELLLALKDVPARIRLGSLEVSVVTEKFLSQMREAGNALPHFHLSLQSGSTEVLKKMNRHYTREEYLQKCQLIYQFFPNASVTTDVIVGFPTEREEDFLQSVSIVKEANFSRVHAFPFSPREGTNAYKLPDLPSEVKRERMARLQEAIRAQEGAFLARLKGREEIALFEEDGGYTGNYVRVYAEGAKEGELCRIRFLREEKDGYSVEILEVLS